MITFIRNSLVNWLANKPLLFSILLIFILAGCNAVSASVPPMQAVPPTSPLAPTRTPSQWRVYLGASSYLGDHLFTIRYDRSQWKYGSGEPFGPFLRHLQIPGCVLILSGGDSVLSTDAIGAVRLVDRYWAISSPSDFDLLYQSYPFGFDIYMFEISTIEAKDTCQQAAQEVIASFQAPSRFYLSLLYNRPAEEYPQPAPHAGIGPLDDSDWPTYTSTKGGYSLRYPSHWSVEEGIKGSLLITDPEGTFDDVIWIGYLDFEKPENDALAVWAEKYFALELGPALAQTLSPVTLSIKDPTGASQQLLLQHEPPSTGEGYLISHGRLVLQLITDSEDANFQHMLWKVANSIAFADTGPINQTQLSYPGPLPDYITIEAWQQRQADSNLATEAVNYRLQTGKVATHLLAKMSESAKAEYERQLAFAADYIAETDRQRQTYVSLLPTPSDVPNSTH